MNREELERLLLEIESDRAERTVSLNDTAKFSEVVCVYANDMPYHRKPGYLFVGANPDGTAGKARIDDQLLQNLAAIRSDGHIQPLPVMNVEKCLLGGGEMAVIEVFPSDLPPVRYKGRVYIRVGPRRAIASEAEERILSERRVATATTWDARPSREASLDDLALDLFALSYRPNAIAREVIEQNDRTIEDQLAALRFYDRRFMCPTNAAVLLFGKDPVFHVPGAYCQFVRYDGKTPAEEVLQERRFTGDLLTIMRGLDQFAQEVAFGRPVRTPELIDQTVYDYPARAMHELLMNAVIHRNYDGSTAPIQINQFEDRIEILSPGGLYGEVTPASFPNATSYRNPILAEAAKVLGFVNRFGRGIAMAQAELSKNGSLPAQFELPQQHVQVTIRKRP